VKRIAVQATVLAATVMSAAAFILHWPCRNGSYVTGRFTSMCYSDLAAYFANPPLSNGDSPFGSDLGIAPLPAALLWLVSKITSNFVLAVVITQLVFSIALLVIGYSGLVQRFWRPMDAMVIVSMPLWPFVMFTSTDIIGVAFAALALAYWSRGKVAVAGAFAGLALISGGWAWILLVAFIVDAIRMDYFPAARKAVSIAIAITAVGQIPTVLAGGNVLVWNSDPGDGNILTVIEYLNGSAPSLSNVIAILGVVGILILARWAIHQPFEFRIEALVLLFVIVQLLTSPTIAPQALTHLAWLIPLVYAQRTFILTYSGFAIAYVMLVWLHLEGTVDNGKGAPDAAYALGCTILLATLLVLLKQTLDIIRVQGADPVRQAMAVYINEKQHDRAH
jgi:hypothetical protein